MYNDKPKKVEDEKLKNVHTWNIYTSDYFHSNTLQLNPTQKIIYDNS